MVDGGQADPGEAQKPVEPKVDSVTVRGVLTRTVEEGGWMVRTEKGDYLLLSSAPFQDEEWFREGKGVEVTGQEDAEAVTLFMQGAPLRVDVMTPLPALDQTLPRHR